MRAIGEEAFDAVANGESVIEQSEAGEVVWRDDAWVTCRRWNWRQGRRTGLPDETRAAFFILDVLAPVTDLELTAAADALAQALSALQLANALTQPNATATKVAVFVTLTSDPDHIAFERLVRESSDGFASVDIVSGTSSNRIDPQEAGRLSQAVASSVCAPITGGPRCTSHSTAPSPWPCSSGGT